MSLRTHNTLLIAILWFGTLSAQETMRVVVCDGETGGPLAGVRLGDGSGREAISDEKGSVGFPWKGRDKVTLTASITGYVSVDTLVSRASVGTVPFVLSMHRSVEEFAPVIIRPGPQVVYQLPDLHVGAYYANAEGLWVLVYEKPGLWHRQEAAGQQVLKGARLHLLDTLFREVHSVMLPGAAVALHHDHMHRPIVEGLDGAWLARRGNTGLELVPLAPGTLERAVLPWTDSIPGRLLGSDRDPTFPAFRHIAFDPRTEQASVVYPVEDTHVMQLFRSQYKYMSGHDKVVAMDLERETGVEREIIAGYMTGFYNDPYFKVPYAPLFVMNDTLCVFDRYAGRISRFDTDLRPSGIAPFSGSFGRERWNTLLQDDITGRVWAVFARGVRTWLREVDTGDGTFGPAITLTHPFPQEVQVNDGHAYYLYRPYGSLQHRTLYRESLR